MARVFRRDWLGGGLRGLAGAALGALACSATSVIAADPAPVSYSKEIAPLFARSCNGCHNPGKADGKLDLTTYALAIKGGETDKLFAEGAPEKSFLMELIEGGADARMPKEGDKLKDEEVALVARWIKEGGKDDTPAVEEPKAPSTPPMYAQPPVISALRFSPDGQIMAVSGFHEVTLHKGDGSERIARLLGLSPRIEAVAFSADGKFLAVAGGAPAQYGEIQLWDLAEKKQLHSWKMLNDTLYGVSFSPDGSMLAFGAADKTARVISAADGQEKIKFENHSDWVFDTCWTMDGKRFLTASRDRAMKLIDANSGQFIDDINKLLEPVLCFDRHAIDNVVVYGGEMGAPRMYRMSENQGRTAANNDVNMIREFERQPGPIPAISFNPLASLVAVGTTIGEVRVYKADTGERVQTWKTGPGAVYEVDFQTNEIAAAGGFDGKVRIFNVSSPDPVKEFTPVPVFTKDDMAKMVSGL